MGTPDIQRETQHPLPRRYLARACSTQPQREAAFIIHTFCVPSIVAVTLHGSSPLGVIPIVEMRKLRLREVMQMT